VGNIKLKKLPEVVLQKLCFDFFKVVRLQSRGFCGDENLPMHSKNYPA
jgi:hypothetical protein